ncbi:MAG: chromosome partitioning protein [Ferrovum sp. 37-45-19]|uniref:ParA family protein n=1 Tax=Ferrovum sp. JA12 TaxID=1356299 RepID=UPI0007031B51|nr:AAA family ATPase [Ferrovum sp. JA12]KRH79389.1 sporulation initiation inhibitor protein Soj [Ferrovum sp. JA12]OYV93976.1 MAG: chromosome partitioning protein [Ferrovum sp. 37-45-19]HQT81810.1 AAA family ATPase [Ferrovaceae bacterium]HQU06763.1 AAA family ATPase [Ferrovaceae bacterium]
MHVLAITNQKGGVGKTTTAVNVCAALVKLGQRVLLVDLDPQGNATTGSGLDKSNLKHSIYDVLLDPELAHGQVFSRSAAGYDVLPANRNLAGAEVELVAGERREFRLKDALNICRDQYDMVLIDCPPTLNLLTINGLTAATKVIIPMQCEYYALEGLSDLVQTVRRVRGHLNPDLEIEGIVRTLLDPRNALAQQVSEQLHKHFGGKVYTTAIPRNVRLAEAPSHGLTAIDYDRSSKGAKAYLALTNEILSRLTSMNHQ